MEKEESKNKEGEQNDENSQTPLKEYASPACYMSEYEEDFDEEGIGLNEQIQESGIKYQEKT